MIWWLMLLGCVCRCFRSQDLKQRYDAKLSAEREATLRLKGENVLMKKRFESLRKDIEDQKEEIKSLQVGDADPAGMCVDGRHSLKSVGSMAFWG